MQNHVVLEFLMLILVFTQGMKYNYGFYNFFAHYICKQHILILRNKSGS